MIHGPGPMMYDTKCFFVVMAIGHAVGPQDMLQAMGPGPMAHDVAVLWHCPMALPHVCGHVLRPVALSYVPCPR